MGMHPDVSLSPFGERIPNLSSDTLVFDTVYNPARTRLLQQAEQAGAKTVGGIDMFVRQAASQFAIWTGRDSPVAVMRQVAEHWLKGENQGIAS
jgi:3-dehydroquinate dehydratase/shikimate dehydrogenase